MLDIVPDASGGRAVDMRRVDDIDERNGSVKTGIARWTEDAEGRTVLKGLGIAFRHSGDDADGVGGEKSGVDADVDIEDELTSIKSSRSAGIMGILRNSWKGKGKAKANGNGVKAQVSLLTFRYLGSPIRDHGRGLLHRLRQTAACCLMHLPLLRTLILVRVPGGTRIRRRMPMKMFVCTRPLLVRL